jgi:hypothetical protein
MVTVRLNGMITEDHKLVIDLPDELPVGPVEVTIQSTEQPSPIVTNPAREAARAKLAAGGLLSNIHRAPAGIRRPTDEEVRMAGIMPPGTKDTLEDINEDRNEE